MIALEDGDGKGLTRAPSQPQNAAALAPTGPPPTMSTSNGSPDGFAQSRSSRRSLQRQSARQARRGSAEAQTDSRQRALGGRREVESNRPRLRIRPTPGIRLPKRLHQAVGEAHDAAAVAARPPENFRSSSARAHVTRGVGDQLPRAERHRADPRLNPCPAIGCSAWAALPMSAVRRAQWSPRARQLQGVRCAPADAPEAAGPPAEAALQLREISVVLERQELPARCGVARPDRSDSRRREAAAPRPVLTA